MSFSVCFITPILGALRNYSKYRTFDPVLFIRTPCITGCLYSICIYYNYPAYLSIIGERWLLLMYKTGVSLYKDDYTLKKAKYIAKGHITSSLLTQ